MTDKLIFVGDYTCPFCEHHDMTAIEEGQEGIECPECDHYCSVKNIRNFPSGFCACGKLIDGIHHWYDKEGRICAG